MSVIFDEEDKKIFKAVFTLTGEEYNNAVIANIFYSAHTPDECKIYAEREVERAMLKAYGELKEYKCEVFESSQSEVDEYRKQVINSPVNEGIN